MPDAPKQDAEEGAPAWMLTFGDMTTLILTFFVLLITMMTIDPKGYTKYLGLFPGLTGNNYNLPTDPDAPPSENYYAQIIKTSSPDSTSLDGGAIAAPDGDSPSIYAFKENFVVQITDTPFFNHFEVVLTEQGKMRLKGVAEKALASSANSIRIIGHYDVVEKHFGDIGENAQGISSGRNAQGIFRPFERYDPEIRQLSRSTVFLNSPRDLASYRALAVEEFLVAHGIERSRMKSTAGQMISDLRAPQGADVPTKTWVPNADGGGSWVVGRTDVQAGAAETQELTSPAKQGFMIRPWRHFVFTEGGDGRARTVEIIVTGDLVTLNERFAARRE